MKALSLWQPWASLVALGVKTLETRSWSTSYRGPLAIHATNHHEPTPGLGWLPGDNLPISAQKLPLGAVVATCELVDVVPMVEHLRPSAELEVLPGFAPMGSDGPGGARLLLNGLGGHLWLNDGECSYDVEDQRPYGLFEACRFAWLLANVVPLNPPAPAKGRQGLWEWDETGALA